MNTKIFKEFLSKRKKIQLARKPQSILSEANKLDNKIRSSANKIEKIFLNYKQAQKEWVNLLTDVSSDLDSLEDDLVKILDKAQEIGVDGRQIDGYSKAADLVTNLQRIARNSKSLYPKV
tara:strand:- start:3228 stop:3587 length:360 start_codon:yes stop_codon:yes gene_type:complete